MPARVIPVNLDLSGNQILNVLAQVLVAHPSSPSSGQFWYRSDLTNGTGSGVLYYRDASGNNIPLATGGPALSNAYSAFTDGTTTATTSGAETFQPVAAGTGLAVAVVNNNGSFGNRDTFTYTLNSATSGANKVLLLDSSGGIAHSSYIILGAGSVTAGKLGWSGTQVTIGDGSTNNQLVDTSTAQSVGGVKTFIAGPILGVFPTTSAGSLGYDSGNGLLSFGDGTTTRLVVTLNNTQTLTNKTLTTPTILDLSNMGHSHQNAAGGGTLLKAAMPSFDTYVQLNRLDQMAAPTASVSMNSQRITNLANGTGVNDAVNLSQLQAAASGLDVKTSVRVASTANVTVTYNATGGTSARGQITAAPNTLDGITLVVGDRILLKNQTAAAQNGIWVVTTLGTGANGVWDRATDFDQDAEVTAGAFTFVTEGTSNADSGFVLTTDDPIVIGGASGTSLSFTKFSGPGTYIAGAGLTQTGFTFDVGANANGTIVVNADDISVSTALASAHTVISGATAGGLYRTSTNTVTARTITAGTGLTVTNGDGSAGNPTVAITNIVTAGTGVITTYNAQGQITSSSDLIGSAGIPARTGTNTYAARTITGNAGRIVITNGDGSAGNPTIDLATGVASAGTYDRVVVNTYGQVTSGVAMGFAANIGDGVATTFVVTHSLGTRDVLVSVYNNSTPWNEIYPEVLHTSTTTVTINFNATMVPTSAQFRVVVKAV